MKYAFIGGPMDGEESEIPNGLLTVRCTRRHTEYVYIALKFKDDGGTQRMIFMLTGTTPSAAIKAWRERYANAKNVAD